MLQDRTVKVEHDAQVGELWPFCIASTLPIVAH
jgi:hypothetical protein